MNRLIKYGDWSLELDLSSGACVRHCRYKGFDVLRPSSQTSSPLDPLNSGGFCLVPFSNRIGGGAFVYGGASVSLSQTHPDIELPIHGLGWRGVWTQGNSPQRESATFDYRHVAGEWPWNFHARQTFTLDANTLTHHLSVTNESGSTMPAGLGFHPYFANASGAQLTASADGVWNNSGQNLPSYWSGVPEVWDFSKGKPVSGARVDNCFTGLQGNSLGGARITQDGVPYAINITHDPALEFAVIYTAADDDSFCYEPVSHMSNALNWHDGLAGTGLRHLAPNATFSVWMRFTLTAR